MRYVIVCVVKGEAGRFNNEMRRDIFKKFNAKSSKLPAHFTIKAPFEYDGSIKELEEALHNFSKKEEKAAFTMERYNHFDDRVIYMDVNMSKEGKELHNRLIDLLGEFHYIKFNKKDGKDKNFHVTLTSKKVPPIFNKLWDYVNQYSFNFSCYFDNISIYKWEESTWKLYREFKIGFNNK
ncbi:MAG: 2'-5' RNA ligase family protein [Clostridium sartagoforme]|nr:2'-5' RNA ligase family protein [Clostridium sartagoforme]